MVRPLEKLLFEREAPGRSLEHRTCVREEADFRPTWSISVVEVGHAAVEVGRGAVHGHHEGVSLDTWRAMEWPAWDAFLG